MVSRLAWCSVGPSFALLFLHAVLTPCVASPTYHPIAGKSLLVDTALRGRFGVMTVRVPAAASEVEITREVFAAITQIRTAIFVDPQSSALRVLKLHAFFFRTPATVVLQVAERAPGKEYADVAAAARNLATLPLRVVLDASDNSLPPDATQTNREQVLLVPTMTREEIEAMEELQELLEALNKAELQDVVWHVVGGSPAKYLQLRTEWKAPRASDVEAAVARFVEKQLLSALITRSRAVKQAGPAYAELLQRFQKEDAVPEHDLQQINSPSPDKVLRLTKAKSGTSVRFLPSFVPADAAMGLVLRYNLQDTPSLSELKDLLKAVKQAASDQSVDNAEKTTRQTASALPVDNTNSNARHN